MEYYEYLRGHEHYFWQWEDNLEVVAIPNENTIAYRAFVLEVLKQLVPQGVPPLGSLLLAIIATNPNGYTSLETVSRMMCDALNTTEDMMLKEAMAFLRILTRMPDEYKTGQKRILLLQCIFQNCHNILSTKNSRKIYDRYEGRIYAHEALSQKNPFSRLVFEYDFRPLGLLLRKFSSIEDILNGIAGLPKVEEPIITEDAEQTKDLVEQLVENPKTFQVGALVKRIWSGLNIPVHSTLPSQQPLGGVSDLTNKGDFDKLLISEFANDDLVFMSRLANNEALYIQREIPPAKNELQRIVLIDVSLKNWGTPKAVAFAIMLAIAKHPKTDIECTAYVVGNSYYPVSTANVHTIIEGLQILEGSLHAAIGLEAFFKAYPPDKNMEVFFITTPSTIKQLAMLKAMNEYSAAIHYLIHADAEGNIDVYKKQQTSKKHIQHMQLPLEELWKKEPKEKRQPSSGYRVLNAANSFPILFRNTMDIRKVIITSDNEIFLVNNVRALFRFYDKTIKHFNKGWEMIHTHLPHVAGEIEIGLMDNGEHVMLMFNPNTREIFLLNLVTKVIKTVLFKQWKSSHLKEFFFYQNRFYYIGNTTWSVHPLTGEVETTTENLLPARAQRMNQLSELTKKYYSSGAILKNVRQLFINENNNLVINTHELMIRAGGHIKLESGNRSAVKHRAAVSPTNTQEYVFADGSAVEVDRSGMLVLKSSNSGIPYIYIPSVVDATLGAVAGNEFAGTEYFYKEPLYQVILKQVTTNRLEVIKTVKEFTGHGLMEVNEMVNTTPTELIAYCSAARATVILRDLEKLGAEAELKLITKPNETQTIEKTDTSSFFKKYIEAFINHINTGGAKN